MKFKTIEFSLSKESVSNGLKEWRKFSGGVELEEADNEDDVARYIEEKVTGWVENRKKAPLIPDIQPSQQQTPSLTKEEKKQQQIQKTIQQINEASDINVVEAFHLLAKNNPEIKEAYDKRIKELSQ